VQLQLGNALGHRGLRPGQEARPHAEGDLAETQVEARRLDLIGRELARGMNPTALRKLRDHLVGQNAFGLRRHAFDLARQTP